VILVTGGAGFVGMNVVEQLSARGDAVLVFDVAIPRLDVPHELGDIADAGAVNRLFAKHRPQAVIHMAAITADAERDAREPRRIAEVNLIGTLNVLEAARRHGVRRIVHASTGALYGAAGIGAAEPLDEERDRPTPETMYGITKYAAERACLRLAALWDLDVRIGRLAMAYGRREHATDARQVLSAPTQIARLARAGREAVVPDLGPTDYIYAPDVARALVALADARSPRHRLYHLGTGVAWALPQWCEHLAQHFPQFKWRVASRAEECNVRSLATIMRTRFSNRRLVEDLGWQPRYDVASSAADFVSWLGAHDER
jgi:nucleoside-diphosphate-sugar epimerase